MYLLWKKLSESERIFSKLRGQGHVIERLGRNYINDRKIFDKVFHKTEREYNRKVVSEIEEICTTDPREF